MAKKQPRNITVNIDGEEIDVPEDGPVASVEFTPEPAPEIPEADGPYVTYDENGRTEHAEDPSPDPSTRCESGGAGVSSPPEGDEGREDVGGGLPDLPGERRQRCRAQTKSGKRCSNFATKSGYCFAHDRNVKARALLRRAQAQALMESGSKVPPLRTVKDVKHIAATVVERLLDGSMDAKTAHAIEVHLRLYLEALGKKGREAAKDEGQPTTIVELFAAAQRRKKAKLAGPSAPAARGPRPGASEGSGTGP
jgi:hypothetical protein